MLVARSFFFFFYWRLCCSLDSCACNCSGPVFHFLFYPWGRVFCQACYTPHGFVRGVCRLGFLFRACGGVEIPISWLSQVLPFSCFMGFLPFFSPDLLCLICEFPCLSVLPSSSGLSVFWLIFLGFALFHGLCFIFGSCLALDVVACLCVVFFGMSFLLWFLLCPFSLVSFCWFFFFLADILLWSRWFLACRLTVVIWGQKAFRPAWHWLGCCLFFERGDLTLLLGLATFFGGISFAFSTLVFLHSLVPVLLRFWVFCFCCLSFCLHHSCGYSRIM